MKFGAVILRLFFHQSCNYALREFPRFALKILLSCFVNLVLLFASFALLHRLPKRLIAAYSTVLWSTVRHIVLALIVL